MPKHEEDNLQMNCVQWFNLCYPKLIKALHHSPNGGKRNAIEGARFKRMGVRAGFPDLALYYPTEECYVLFIEMKTTSKSSTQKVNQKEYEEYLNSKGYKYVICRSFDEFRQIIKDHLKDKRE